MCEVRPLNRPLLTTDTLRMTTGKELIIYETGPTQLSTAKLEWSPEDMMPPSFSADSPMEEDYTEWQEITAPRLGANLYQHLDNTVGLVANAASGAQFTHDQCYNVVQFLNTILSDEGQMPRNIRALVEFIDYKTKDDGTEAAGQSKCFAE